MGIEKGTYWDEHWVSYTSDDSREYTPKTKSILYTLYVRQIDNKLYLKERERENNELFRSPTDLIHPHALAISRDEQGLQSDEYSHI